MYPRGAALIAVIGLAGCGRIDFDPRPPGADAAEPAWPTLAGTWTWIGGPDLGQQPGSYGMRGVPSATNQPGPRDNGASWSVADGSMWLFGGAGLAGTSAFGRLGDLWRFDPDAGKWTWINGPSTVNVSGTYGVVGVPAPTNQPGGRNDSAGWTDAVGDLWMFGGFGLDAAGCTNVLDDLWRFQISSGDWTWMAGSSSCSQPGTYGTRGVPDAANTPGGRSGVAIWTSSDGAWMFGGDGYDRAGTNGRLGDLWRYQQNAWTWMGGSDVADQPPAPGYPGSRSTVCAWTRPDELWLFGGGAIDGRHDDLWRYTISTGVWTSVAGPSAAEQPGIYGVRGVSDLLNTPGARISSACWQDARGDLWLFGGRGRDRAGTLGALSDLWVYVPATGAWTWVAGSDVADQVGHYGTLGVTDPVDSPGGRSAGDTWTRSDGSLWLFGGDFAFDSMGATNQLSDLWRCGPP